MTAKKIIMPDKVKSHINHLKCKYISHILNNISQQQHIAINKLQKFTFYPKVTATCIIKQERQAIMATILYKDLKQNNNITRSR